MYKRICLLVALLSLCGISGCGNSKKLELVWLVTESEFAEYRQELINAYLEEKGADYTITLKSVIVDTSDPEALEGLDEIDLVTGYDYDAHMEKVQRMAEKGEQVDILFVPALATNMEYENHVKMGLLEPLDAYLEYEGKNSEVYTTIHERVWNGLKIDGEIYGISNPYTIEGRTYSYNTYYLDKYGITAEDISPDITQNMELFDQIYDAEEGEVTMIANTSYILYDLPIYQLAPSRIIGINKEGQVVNKYEDEAVIAYLRKINELRQKGYLGLGYTDGDEAFEKENGFFATDYGINYTETERMNMAIYEGQEVLVIPGEPMHQYGYFPLRFQINGIASWSENKEVAFEFLNLLYTDRELANLVAYGEEGIDYTQEDGVITYEYASYPGYTNQLITYAVGYQMKNKEEAHEVYYSTGAENAVNSFRFDPTPVQEQVDATNAVIFNTDPERISVFTVLAEKLNNLDTEAESLEELLDEICRQLEEAGLQTVLEEAQRQYDAFLKQ